MEVSASSLYKMLQMGKAEFNSETDTQRGGSRAAASGAQQSFCQN